MIGESLSHAGRGIGFHRPLDIYCCLGVGVSNIIFRKCDSRKISERSRTLLIAP